MGAKTPRRMHTTEESRRRILEAAFEIANELGYEGTSVAKVSERSGLPVSSVYWHFGSKDGLLAEVITDSFQQWEAANMIDEPEPPRSTLDEHLTDIYRHVVGSYASNPQFWRLGLMLALEQRIVEVTARRRFLEIREAVLTNAASWWRDRIGADALARRPELPDLLARFSMATMDGMFIASQTGANWDFETIADLLAASLAAATRS